MSDNLSLKLIFHKEPTTCHGKGEEIHGWTKTGACNTHNGVKHGKTTRISILILKTYLELIFLKKNATI